MNSARGNLIYTAFAAVVFTVIQYVGGERDAVVLATTGLMFFVFTFGMLRVINRLMQPLIERAARKRRARVEADRGPTEVPPRTARPDHVRRRRDRRRRR
ncbi:MAG: hypothetical protein WD058_03790 [Dehalococcoidia bacterium]